MEQMVIAVMKNNSIKSKLAKYTLEKNLKFGFPTVFLLESQDCEEWSLL